jgi:drug/metabolite transporter (DMT)-like permease
MMGWGEIFSLASAAIWALAVILMRRAGDTMPAFELNLFKNCLGLVLVFPTILLFGGMYAPDYSPVELLIVFCSGIIGISIADTWYLRALNLMGASRTGIVASLFSPFVILLSTIFLGERMVPAQWLGFFLVISGVLLVTWRVKHSAQEKANIKKGAIYGIASMFMMALGIVMVKEILETQPLLLTLEVRLAGGVAGMVVFMLVRGQWQSVKANFQQPHSWGTIITASFLAAYLSLLLWLAGYRLIDASVASILNETNVVFIILLAWLMLGERIDWRKVAGIALTVGGVIAMVLL